MLEIVTIGGFNEVGRNCTAVKVDDELVVVDLGIHLENYIKLTEDEDIVKVSTDSLVKVGAVPNLSVIKEDMQNVKALVISHAHLDHAGAVPFLAQEFNAPIIGTHFTTEVIKGICKEDKINLPNKFISLPSNSEYKISDNITLEFVHITHSTPQTVLVVLHTKYGTIVYANDFKLDLHPVLGKKPNFERLESLGKEGVKALICESTYADHAMKTPSESVAKEMLRDVMLGTLNQNNLMIVTTFSSHMARLKSIIEFGKKLDRKIIFLGRSLAKYVSAAENAGIVNFTKDVEICKYSNQIKRKLKKIEKDRDKYLLVVTGHQGEPQSVLSKIAHNQFKVKLYPEDSIIFSCRVIPTPTNQENRDNLEKELKHRGIRIFKDIHQSGHAAREDLRDFLNFLKPENIIPAHGDNTMQSALADLAMEMGYNIDKNIFLMKDGSKIDF